MTTASMITFGSDLGTSTGKSYHKTTPPPLPTPAALPYRTGVEWTAIVTDYVPDENCEQNTHRLVQFCNEKTVEAIESNFTGGCLHTDGHCIEWSSPPYDTWRELQDDYDKFYRIMRQNCYAPRHPLTICGGGHIHVNVPHSNVITRLQHFIYSYPVLPWIFLQPEDTESGSHPYEYYQKYFTDLTSSGFSCTKDFAVCNSDYKDDRIEFRFFQAAKNWQEQKLHIEFAHALVRYSIESQHVWRPAKLKSERQLALITKQQAIDMFKHVCALIDFDWQRCEYLFSDNLYPRWQRGYSRT